MSEINNIRPGNFSEHLDETSFKKVSIPVPDSLLPPGRFLQLFSVPKMGRHIISKEEFSRQVASHELVLGGNNGHLIFYEPIIFRNFLDDFLNCNQFPFAAFGQRDLYAEEQRGSIEDNLPPGLNITLLPPELRSILRPTDAPEPTTTPRVCQSRMCRMIPRVQNTLKQGFYPTRYCISYDNSDATNPVLQVSLEDFEHRDYTALESSASGAYANSLVSIFSALLIPLLIMQSQ